MTTLPELSEPLLLYVCRINRANRKGVAVSYAEVRREIEQILQDMKSKSTTEPGLASKYARIEDAMVFFVDSLIAESDLPFADEWHQNRLAYEVNERAGDDKFYDILEEQIADRSEESVEAVSVLYNCLGLGFEGYYAGAPEEINAKMLECAAKIRGQMDKDTDDRICPETYEHLDLRNLIEPPGAKIGAIAVAFACLLVVLLVASWAFYSSFTGDLSDALTDIKDPERAVSEGGDS